MSGRGPESVRIFDVDPDEVGLTPIRDRIMGYVYEPLPPETTLYTATDMTVQKINELRVLYMLVPRFGQIAGGISRRDRAEEIAC